MKKQHLKFLVQECVQMMLKEGSFEDTLRKAGVNPNTFGQTPKETLPGFKHDHPINKKKPQKPLGNPRTNAPLNIGPLDEKRIQDPSKEEMMQFLQDQFGRFGDEGFHDSAEVAMYWFANFNHGGQNSNLYSVLSTSPFSPGPISRGPEKDSMEEYMFKALEHEFGSGDTHGHHHADDDHGHEDPADAMQEDGGPGGSAGAAAGGQGGPGQPGTGLGNVTANVDPIRTPRAFKHPKNLPAHVKEGEPAVVINDPEKVKIKVKPSEPIQRTKLADLIKRKS